MGCNVLGPIYFLLVDKKIIIRIIDGIPNKKLKCISPKIKIIH